MCDADRLSVMSTFGNVDFKPAISSCIVYIFSLTLFCVGYGSD